METDIFQLYNNSLKYACPGGDSFRLVYETFPKNIQQVKHKLLPFLQIKHLKPIYFTQLYFFFIMTVMPQTSDTKLDMEQTVLT